MKKKSKIIVSFAAVMVILALAAVIFWFSMPSEQRNMLLFMMTSGESYENYQEYQVVDRNESAPAPTSFEPVAAETTDDDYNSNITVIAGRMLNESSKMFKQASVQINGAADYTGWQLIADEGAAEGSNPFGPSPLSYLTAGVASNLHTQILRAAEVMDVELDSVKVEVLNTFRWDNMLSVGGAGFLDETYTNIIIESDESEEIIQNLIEIALNSWTAGEALANPTVIEPVLVVNGDNWDNNRTVPGTTQSDVSIVDEITISHVTDVPKKPEYLQLTVEEEDEGLSIDFDAMSNMEFEIFAISESAEDPERPYLKKVTVSTPSPETWEIYSDELNGTDGTPLAPTSLEYLTADTILKVKEKIKKVKFF